jgi:hypothetical protein
LVADGFIAYQHRRKRSTSIHIWHVTLKTTLVIS